MGLAAKSLKSIFGRTHSKKLREKLGDPCFEFFEENQIALLAMTQALLSFRTKFPIFFNANCIDFTFMLAPATKAFEGYLEKLIQAKNLKTNGNDTIGNVFNRDRQSRTYTELRLKDYDSTPKIIHAEWNRCRNRILHYNQTFFVKTIPEAEKIYEKMLDVIKEAYEAYIGESDYTPPRPPIPPAVTAPKTELDNNGIIDAMRRKLDNRKSIRRYPDDEDDEKPIIRYP